MAQLNTRIVLRNDTTGNWTTADANSDLVLLKGEIGIEYDASGNVKMKVGDGTTNWSALPYFSDKEAIEAKADKSYVDTELEKKANAEEVYKKTETYTKSEVQTQIENKLNSAGLLKRKVVETLPAIGDASEEIVYMIKKQVNSQLIGDYYEEYMLIDGAFELIGNTYVDLSDYVKQSDFEGALEEKANKGTTLSDYGIENAYTKDQTDQAITDKISEINGGESAGEVLGQLNDYKKVINLEVWGDENGPGTDDKESRIDTLEAIGAQANVIESITIQDEAIAIDNKTIQLPLATAKAGLVKSSTEENKVSVDGEGVMTVNSINVEKLVQSNDSQLVLNGGSATV